MSRFAQAARLLRLPLIPFGMGLNLGFRNASIPTTGGVDIHRPGGHQCVVKLGFIGVEGRHKNALFIIRQSKKPLVLINSLGFGAVSKRQPLEPKALT